MSAEERDGLEVFFRHVLFWDHGCFVLFGSKPCSLSGFWHLVDDIFPFMAYQNRRVEKGWHVWKKYEKLFPKSNFLMFDNPSLFNDRYTMIFCVNLHSLKVVLENNREVFEKKLGKKLVIERVIEDFLEKKGTFQEIMNDHELIGILMGYGCENSWLFERRGNIDARYFSLFTLTKEKSPSKGFSSIEEEINWMDNTLVFSPIHHRGYPDLNFLRLQLPVFLANPKNRETHDLEWAYYQEYKEITRIFNGNDALEKIFEKLFEEAEAVEADDYGSPFMKDNSQP